MKPNQRIKLSDLASMLNLSTSTISRALNDHPRIPTETKKKVKALAKDLSYHPNPFAKGLLQKQTKTIGVLIPTFGDVFFSKTLESIEEELFVRGYKMIIVRSGKTAEQEKKACWELAKSHVDGIIAAFSFDHENISFINDINDEGIPMLFLDRALESVDANFVISDDYIGAFNAVKHLIVSGRKNIIHLEGPEEVSTAFFRRQGYEEALRSEGIPIQENYIIQCKSEKVVKDKLIALEHHYDAVFCFNDYYAFEYLEFAQQRNIPVPTEVAVIGFSDAPMCQYTTPKLSSVDQSSGDMGKSAVDLLLNEISCLKNKKPIEYQTIKTKTSLVLRESC
ncbi:LacI family DNA-binding transcriptional regulator [Flammeovirga sp. SubArs3]|uniref:LacI family DNA-binding transcriptional regulator n=1 Tax=Flammeovirga sp. SubArs3 TaxID=2995316 RepID=UPI00248B1750|nr:LacI family DNA-binding transcriptional regulator [Flammeovirga sp. SubArs3]